jgi:TatD DNase family protein
MKLVDTHAHLLDERLSGRITEIIESFSDDGLDFVVEIGTCMEDSKEVLELANKYDNLYCTAGVHPHYAEMYDPEFENWVKSAVCNRKIVAIGECGLDYHYENNPKPGQVKMFVRHIKLAHEVGLPLVVHSREAYSDTFQILKEHKKFLTNGLLFHCFNYGEKELKELLDEFDSYFAFGGAITYKKNEALCGAACIVPLNRMLIETDCPYLAPCPLRGTVNEPKNVKIIADFIAKLRGAELEEIARVTTENAREIYRIGKQAAYCT